VKLNFKGQIQKIPQSVKLAILVVLAAKILIFAVGFATTYLNTGAHQPLAIIMDMFNKWDAPHYVDIAKNWYVNTGDAANFIVFFPLYPILIRLFTVDFNYATLSALIISNVCSLIGFLYLYKLAKLEFNDGVAVKAVLFLSVFPTAYFLSAPYTEGLFFAVVIASMYYARLGRWEFAGLTSLFAALTRLAGLSLMPVLLVEYFHQRGWKPKKLDLNILWVFSALAGYLIYLNINYQVTGNPFTYMTIEATHWSNRFDPKSGVMAAYSWATTASYPSNITIGAAQLAFAIFGLMILGVSVWKRLRPAYILYMFLIWALSVSESWWLSVPRYIMTMFPMFMLFGLLARRKSVTIAVAVVSLALLCYFTVFFARGWFAF
jgi:hypothetical protein